MDVGLDENDSRAVQKDMSVNLRAKEDMRNPECVERGGELQKGRSVRSTAERER